MTLSAHDAMIKAYVFDAYGTLFDVHSAVARHAARIGPQAQALSELWRARQVEYAWTYSLMGRKSDFWTLTQQALDYAMARFGVSDAALRADLLQAYLELSAFPEVPDMLRRLRERGAITAILSNGTQKMVEQAVESAGIKVLIDHVWSIDDVGIFKPHPSVYQLVLDRLGVTVADVSFQSSNAWDAAGAANFGFRVVRVNRQGLPREYPVVNLAHEVVSLADLPALDSARV
jgi:2-haloacid dehalogenase